MAEINNLIEELESLIISKTMKGKTQKNSAVQTSMVIEKLEKHGFQGKDNIRKIPTQPGLYYVEQPNGTQRFPDFTLFNVSDSKKLSLDLELKVGNKKIMWNDGFPIKNAIYIFTCTKYKKSKLFTTDSFPNYEEELTQYKTLCDTLCKMNKGLKQPDSYFRLYVRKCTQQTIDVNTIGDDTVYRLFKKFFDIKQKSMPDKIKAISLFSGAGGDTLGMTNSGIDVIGYVENDKNAIETHDRNFENCKLIGKDITKIPDEKFSEYKNIDIIFGGFPCQTFSHGGKKNPTDKRGFLYQEFVRASRIIRPKIIIGENVKGLLSRQTEDGKLFLEVISKEFEDIGYRMKYTLFNMKNYNIPQSRERLLLYGVRSDLDIKMSLENVLVEGRRFNKDILSFSLTDALKIDSKDILGMIDDDKYIVNELDNSKPTGRPPTNLTKCYTNGQLSFKKRIKSTYSCIIDLDDVSRTILSTYGRMPRLFVPVRNLHGSYLRPYTIEELQQIQGFPKTYVFCGNYTNQVRQIGNAIPPIFITYIMEYVRDILTYDVVEL